MAEENEVKKPIIEMSVWFIAFLVLLIISTLLVIKLNGDKSRLQNELKASEDRFSQMESMHSTMIESARAMIKNYENMTPSQVKVELGRMVSGDEVEAEVPVEEPATVSGEVAE